MPSPSCLRPALRLTPDYQARRRVCTRNSKLNAFDEDIRLVFLHFNDIYKNY